MSVSMCLEKSEPQGAASAPPHLGRRRIWGFFPGRSWGICTWKGWLTGGEEGRLVTGFQFWVWGTKAAFLRSNKVRACARARVWPPAPSLGGGRGDPPFKGKDAGPFCCQPSFDPWS